MSSWSPVHKTLTHLNYETTTVKLIIIIHTGNVSVSCREQVNSHTRATLTRANDSTIPDFLLADTQIAGNAPDTAANIISILQLNSLAHLMHCTTPRFFLHQQWRADAINSASPHRGWFLLKRLPFPPFRLNLQLMGQN